MNALPPRNSPAFLTGNPKELDHRTGSPANELIEARGGKTGNKWTNCSRAQEKQTKRRTE